MLVTLLMKSGMILNSPSATLLVGKGTPLKEYKHKTFQWITGSWSFSDHRITWCSAVFSNTS